MKQIKRGVFYKFAKPSEAMEFLKCAKEQFGISCNIGYYNKYCNCEALAISNGANAIILYRTKINPDYGEQFTPWNEDNSYVIPPCYRADTHNDNIDAQVYAQFICGERSANKTNNNNKNLEDKNMHKLIKKYTDEALEELAKKRHEKRDEVFEQTDFGKEIKPVNEILAKYGFETIPSYCKAVLTEEQQVKLVEIDKEYDNERKKIIDKAEECQAIIEASDDAAFILLTLQSYGYIRNMEAGDEQD